jgi:hypothetical protein
MKMWPTYPYRQNTSEAAHDISRSFSFRPGLRLGIVYNRLNTQSVFQQMKNSPNYKQVAGLALHSLLQCDWNPQMPKTKEAVLNKLGNQLTWKRRDHLQLEYGQIFKLFGLKVNDIDIRYSYNHEGYKNTDSTKNIMAPGYIGKYFNAYFDGTATVDELLIADLLKDLSATYPQIFKGIEYRGLEEKYKHLQERYHYDKAIFQTFDRMGLWFPIPYPKEVFMKHHRESYTSDLAAQYKMVCSQTAQYLKEQFVSK